MRIVAFLVGIIFISSFVFAGGSEKKILSKEEGYDFQERCGKASAEYFKEMDIKDDLKTGKWMRLYHNHYNVRLNKCFIYLESMYLPYDRNEKDITGMNLYIKLLADVHEHKAYGHYSSQENKVLGCDVLGVDCGGRSEFESLIAPYMTE